MSSNLSVGIFYSSSIGYSSCIAKKIAKHFSNSQAYDISDTQISEINKFQKIIIGAEVLGEEIDKEIKQFIQQLKNINKDNREFALFCDCDNQKYSDNFADGLYFIYKELQMQKAKTIGLYHDWDYDFYQSKAFIDDGFLVGLVTDEENQSELTDKRIKDWCQKLKYEFGSRK